MKSPPIIPVLSHLQSGVYSHLHPFIHPLALPQPLVSRPAQNPPHSTTFSPILGPAFRLILPLPHSFHGEVWSYVRLLLSIPLVQLRAAHTPNARRARFRARSGSAALRGLTAPLCAQPSPL